VIESFVVFGIHPPGSDIYIGLRNIYYVLSTKGGDTIKKAYPVPATGWKFV
jgi:hypothetical protein